MTILYSISEISYFLQIAGSILAILGAVYNCSPKKCDKLTGFGIWVVSNSTLLLWSVITGNYWLSAMYSVFCCTSIYGVLHHRGE